MATVKSNEMTTLTASPPGKLQTNDLAGRVRVAYFSKTTASEAVSDVVQLTKLPSGARVLALFINSDALTSGAGTSGASFGDTGDPDRLATAVNLDAAVNAFTALRKGANLGTQHKYTAETIISATVTGEAWANAADFQGYILYVVD
jgi:hypothetical protein